jgi:hypothetical protein
LWRAGGSKKATVAMLNIPAIYIDRNLKEEDQDEAVAKALEGVCLDSGKELHGLVRFCDVTSISSLHQQLQNLLPGFRSPMGALLLLFSALLSRGLVSNSPLYYYEGKSRSMSLTWESLCLLQTN